MNSSGRVNYKTHYLCTICQTKRPKYERVGTVLVKQSRFCPECGECMRSTSHHKRNRQILELAGVIKRY